MKILTAYKHVRRFWWSRQFGIIVILCILLVSLLRDRSSLLLLTKHSTSTTISGTISTKNSLVTRQQGGSSPSSSYQQQQHLIHLNTNSSYVSSDIVKIVHKPKEEYQIEIHLKDNNNNNNNNRRQCQNPIYIGRISGSSLSIINFANFDYKKNRTQNKYNNTDTDNDNDNDNSMNNVIIGKYDLSTTATIANANANANKSGIYYIEILILLCEEPNYWNDDLYKVCLKDSNIPHTRITSSPATININNIDAVVDTTTAAIITKEINENQITTTSMTVTAAVPAAAGGSKSQSGRWLHTSFIEEERKNRKRRHEEDDDDDDDDHDTDLSVSLLLPQPQPLYTRYQPKGCMESEKYFKSTKNTTECLAAVDLSPFSSYKFVWDDPYMNRPFLPVKYLVQQKQNNNMNDEDNNNNNNNRAIPPTHVCFVGLSHSGTLVKKCNSLLKRHMKTKKKKNNATSIHDDDDDDEADDINNDDVLPFQLKCSHIQVKFPFQIIRGGPPDSPNDDYQYTNTNTNTNTTMTHQEQQAIIKEQNIRRRHQQQKVWVHENLTQPKCTHVVIGLYQWPFSLYQTEISSQLFFNEWKNDLKNVIKIITRNSNDKMKIILRSVHTNGLKEHILTCPAIDFRTPYNTIICNQILQDIVTDTNNNNNNNTTTTSKGSGIITTTNSSSSNDDDGNDSIISYINTNFITEPVWDSKEDWSHLRGEAGTEEIKYILYEILRQHK